jgi:ABC-type glycerol-3-phosphate transport system permease component
MTGGAQLAERPVLVPAATALGSRRGVGQRLLHVLRRSVIYLVLVAGGLLFTLPFIWMVSTSLSEPGAAVQLPPRWIPQPVVWTNYARAWTVLPFAAFTRNRLIYAGAALVGQLISCSLVAYGFARIRFRGRGVWFTILLATMMLPSQVTLIPQFILFRNLHWLDTLLPLIVPAWFGNALYIFLLCGSSSSPCRRSWTTPPASTAPTPSRPTSTSSCPWPPPPWPPSPSSPSSTTGTTSSVP